MKSIDFSREDWIVNDSIRQFRKGDVPVQVMYLKVGDKLSTHSFERVGMIFYFGLLKDQSIFYLRV